jgi:glycosyltransferase involved in cell wall biosynthesis
MTKSKKIFSIIVPVYQNEENLDDTLQKLISLQDSLSDYDLELIFVDDGSTDRSYDILQKTYNRYKDKLVIVKLTRNFGQIAAIYAGFSLARGECVGIISADLQDPHELFIEMIKRWERGVKLVIAERADREDKNIATICSRFYWKMVRRTAGKDFPIGGFDFCLIDKQVVSELIRINEKNSNVFILMFTLGYRRELLLYTRKKRQLGKSKWSLSKKIKLVIDTFVADSYLPLRMMSILGFIISILSFLLAIGLVINRLIKGTNYPGWTSTFVIIMFFGGLILLSLGIIGEYIWRIFEETRKRPNYVIDEILTRKISEDDHLS